jgi:hypothetical protein
MSGNEAPLGEIAQDRLDGRERYALVRCVEGPIYSLGVEA